MKCDLAAMSAKLNAESSGGVAPGVKLSIIYLARSCGVL